MTKNEFIDRYKAESQRAERRDLKVAIVGLGLMIVTAAAVISLIKYIERLDGAQLLLIDSGCLLFGMIGLLFVLAPLVLRAPLRFPGVPCPRCKRGLVGIDIRIAFLTGNCGHCGERVVDDFGGRLDPERGPGIYALQRR